MEVVCAMGLICTFAAVHICWAGRGIWGQVQIRTFTGPGAAQDLGFPGLAKTGEGHKGDLSLHCTAYISILVLWAYPSKGLQSVNQKESRAEQTLWRLCSRQVFLCETQNKTLTREKLYQVLSTKVQNLQWNMTDVIEKGKHGYLDKLGKLHRYLPKEQQRGKSVLLPQHCYLKCQELQSTIVLRGRQKDKNVLNSSFLKTKEVSFYCPSCHQDPSVPVQFPQYPLHSLRRQRPLFLSHILLKATNQQWPIWLCPHWSHPFLCLLVSPRPSSSTWSGAPDTWQSSAGTRWVNAAHRGPWPHCAWQWEGKFHFHLVPGGYTQIPSPAFVHISEQCSASTSLPLPLPLTMLSAVNLCSGNPGGAQSLPHSPWLEETKGLVLLSCKW